MEQIFNEARLAAKAAGESSHEQIQDRDCCGFAWCEIRPARGPFVKWLKTRNIGSSGVYGGWRISRYAVWPEFRGKLTFTYDLTYE